MRLKVNGDEHITEKNTVMDLLREMNIVPERVAVEVNLAVIKRGAFRDFRLKDGDSVEIVNFVGGGQLSAGDRSDVIQRGRSCPTF